MLINENTDVAVVEAESTVVALLVLIAVRLDADDEIDDAQYAGFDHRVSVLTSVSNVVGGILAAVGCWNMPVVSTLLC